MRTHRPGRRILVASSLPALVLAVALAGCTTISDPSPTASPADATASPGPSGVPTDVGATPEPSPPSQSETAFGTIWDGLPDSFPAFPGAGPTETGEGPASALLDVGDADPAEVIRFYQSALEFAGYVTLSLDGPLENGSWELELTGERTCRILINATPLGGTTIITILYRADCPFE